MKCTRKTVQHVLATFLFETFQGRNSQPERPRKMTECEDRYILHIIKQNNSVPLCDITNIINNKIDVPISEHTVRRRRSEAGLGRYIAATKPGLRLENVMKRLEWALRYKDWTIEDWKCIICLMNRVYGLGSIQDDNG